MKNKLFKCVSLALTLVVSACSGPNNNNGSVGGGSAAVVLDPPAPGASTLSGHAYNVDTSKYKVVVYALTNQWYVQPFIDSPFTDISKDGKWTTTTHPWDVLVILVVDPTTYNPTAIEITKPALDAGVIASTQFPVGPASVDFSGYKWGIKLTGSSSGYQFDPGPNFWSNNPAVVHVANDGLHLKITKMNEVWWCGEVYLLHSLGYGTYTVKVGSRLDQLDLHTVAAPIFIYADDGRELDNEYSGMNGLIPSPNNAQFVVQPYYSPGNLLRYLQPPGAQFTSQMEWRSDHVTFTTWNGWDSAPKADTLIYQWTYLNDGQHIGFIPIPGNERVRINLWLMNGSAPANGVGDEMIINSFSFQP